MTCDPKVAPSRQKHQLSIKGSNQLYQAISSELLSDYSFSSVGSQGHQLVLKMYPVVFYIYIKTVAHDFEKYSVSMIFAPLAPFVVLFIWKSAFLSRF